MFKNDENKSYVIYKLKNNKKINLLFFVGTYLTRKQAIRLIKEKEVYGVDDIRLSEFEGREFEKDEDRIHRYTTVEVTRTPSEGYQKKAGKTNKIEFPLKQRNNLINVSHDSFILKSDEKLMNEEEEDRILDSVVNYAARNIPPHMFKSSVPPKSYVCRICNVPGHFIQQCPGRKKEFGTFQPKIEHKLPSGIPKTRLEEVEPGTKGAYLDNTGKYYLLKKDAFSTTVNKSKPIFSLEENPKFIEKIINIPPKFSCNICNKSIETALKTPCCKRNYCSDCILNKLFDPEIGTGGLCPNCSQPIPLIDMLIENTDLDIEISKWKESLKDDSLLKDCKSNAKKAKCDVMPSIPEDSTSDSLEDVSIDIDTLCPEIPPGERYISRFVTGRCNTGEYRPSVHRDKKPKTPSLECKKEVDKINSELLADKSNKTKENIIRKELSEDSQISEDVLKNTYIPSTYLSPLIEKSKETFKEISLKKDILEPQKRNYADNKDTIQECKNQEIRHKSKLISNEMKAKDIPDLKNECGPSKKIKYGPQEFVKGREYKESNKTDINSRSNIQRNREAVVQSICDRHDIRDDRRSYTQFNKDDYPRQQRNQPNDYNSKHESNVNKDHYHRGNETQVYKEEYQRTKPNNYSREKYNINKDTQKQFDSRETKRKYDDDSRNVTNRDNRGYRGQDEVYYEKNNVRDNYQKYQYDNRDSKPKYNKFNDYKKEDDRKQRYSYEERDDRSDRRNYNREQDYRNEDYSRQRSERYKNDRYCRK